MRDNHQRDINVQQSLEMGTPGGGGQWINTTLLVAVLLCGEQRWAWFLMSMTREGLLVLKADSGLETDF